MMDIKFRGKTLKTGKWIYGNLFTANESIMFGENEKFSNTFITENKEIEVDYFCEDEEFCVNNTFIQIISTTVRTIHRIKR